MRTFQSEARRLERAYTTGEIIPDMLAHAIRWWLVRQRRRRRTTRRAWRSRVFRGGTYGRQIP